MQGMFYYVTLLNNDVFCGILYSKHISMGEYKYELRKKKLRTFMAACMAWLMDTANALCRRIHGVVY